jgi:predicted CXXCH cytochrome family protein
MLRYKETTIYTEFRNGNRNLHFVHVADTRKGRTCRTCHESHASTGKKLISEEGMPFGDWKVQIRFSQTATGGSCAPGCHRPFNYDREEPVDYRKEGL